jgi:hypothetical protein
MEDGFSPLVLKNRNSFWKKRIVTIPLKKYHYKYLIIIGVFHPL